jgi:uncharacterized phage-like protein YoqJ
MKTVNGKTVCFTGHRPQKLPFGFNEYDIRCLRLKMRLGIEIKRQITECGAVRFISGMAAGTDIFAAEIVLELKEKYPHIILECALPCKSQADRWDEENRKRYRSILKKSDRKVLLQRKYTSDCMQKRNKYMVDNSDTVIAVWNGSASGTGNTVRYAMSSGKEVIIIDPARV